MGTFETRSKATPVEVSSPSPEKNAKAQVAEHEKKELREALDALKGGDGRSEVQGNGGQENSRVWFSSRGNQGLDGDDDDGVVEVVKNRVFETKVLVQRDFGGLEMEDDCQGLADSEMNGVSSLLKMRESGRFASFSRGGGGGSGRVADLDSIYSLSGGGSIGVGGEERIDGKKSQDDENDEDHDGKIVTIDVPIAETNENKDAEMEDLTDAGFGFAVGDFVWGKIKSHPWWPGRIYDPSDASDYALKLNQKNRLLVAYFGDGTFAWCHPSQLKPFEENFEDMVKQSSSRAFVKAVEEAVKEVGRLLEMQMSYSFVAKKIRSEFTLPFAKNSGVKDEVLVPENGIGRLSAVLIDPVELLSRMKQIAEFVTVASILELEILRVRLSVFYLSRGGYKLPKYEVPQPVPGLEDSVMDETVHVGNDQGAVEAPVQGPVEEDYSTLPVNPKFGESCHSPGISGNRSSHRRKQKSIAEILGEDKDVHAKKEVGNATQEALSANGSTSRKKRKGSEDATASKPVQKRKDVLSGEKDGNGGKENSDMGSLSWSKERKEDIRNENISSGSKKETGEEGKAKRQKEKGSLSRERKRSKYLSPPFTASLKGKRGTESPKVSSKVQVSEGMTRAADELVKSPLLFRCNSETVQENVSHELPVMQLSERSNYQTPDDNEKKTIDPTKIMAPSGDVLSEVCSAAVSPQIPRESGSLEKFVDFISVFRNSLYCQGSYYKVYKKQQAARKRKKPELGQNQTDHVSPNNDSEPRKRRRKETSSGTPKKMATPETKTGKKGSVENASGAVLFVSFGPGSSLPSKSDVVTLFSKFGALNEAETDIFRSCFTARVSFLRRSDAERAFSHSHNTKPFGSSDVSFRLQYLSAASTAGENGEKEKSKPSLARKKVKAPAPALVPARPSVLPASGSEASKLNYIKQKLQALTSMLEAVDGKSLVMKAKLEREMKSLLDDVNKMVESSSS